MTRFDFYLGLPTLIGRANYQTFSFSRIEFGKNCKVGRGMMFSRVRKEVLIKAIAQFILIYNMGVFQLPLKLCEELNALCAKSW